MALPRDKIIQWIAAGFEMLEYHVLDSSGFIAGATGSVAAGATGASAVRLYGVQTSNLSINQPNEEGIPGDDGSLGQFSFDPENPPAFDIDVGIQDLDSEARFQGTKVYEDGDILFGGLQPSGATRPTVCLIGTSRAKAQGVGYKGIAQYAGVIIPKAELVPLGRVSFEGRKGGAVRYRVITQMADSLGIGQTFTLALNGYEIAPIIPWSAENRMTMHRWTGDGATTTFTGLGYKPASSAIAKNRVRLNANLQLSGITISPTGKSVAFGAAPANLVPITDIYEYVKS